MKIGCDPEYILYDEANNKILKAQNIRLFHSTSSKAKVGCDGAGTPVEIRPAPSSIRNVNRLCENVNGLLKRIARYVNGKKYKLFAGCGDRRTSKYDDERYYVPIGGHIHFGSPTLNKWNRKKLIHILDTYFTPLTNMMINSDSIRQRIESGYGKLKAYETKAYGFEYRTPYNFMVSPYFTKTWFSLASLLANNFKKIKRNNDMFYTMKDWYESRSHGKNLEILYPMIKKKILKIMGYNTPNPKQNGYIISLFNLIERKKKYKSLDVIKNYGFESIKPDQSHKPARLIYNPDKYMDELCGIMLPNIKIGIIKASKKLPNDILLYGVASDDHHTDYLLVSPELYNCSSQNYIVARYLTQPTPPITLSQSRNREPTRRIEIPIMIGRSGMGNKYEYSIGFSLTLREKIVKGIINPNEIIHYLFNSERSLDDYV